MNTIMEMSKSEKHEDPTKRKRTNIAALNNLLKSSDDENSFSEGEDSEEFSEDEWGTNKKKSKDKKKNKSPVQTLKKKLAEKTKTLRKSIKLNNTRLPEVEKESATEKESDLVPIKSEKSESIIKEEIAETKERTAVNDKISNVKIDAIPKIEKDVSAKPVKKNEPVVLTYSTVKNSACISPFLLQGTQSENLSSSLISFPLASVSSSPASTVPSTFQLSPAYTVATQYSDLSTSSSQSVNFQSSLPPHNNHSVSSNVLTNPVALPDQPSNILQNEQPFSVYSPNSRLNQTSFPLNSMTDPSSFPNTTPVPQNFIAPQKQSPNVQAVSPCTNIARLRINPNLQTSPGMARSLINLSTRRTEVPKVSPKIRSRNLQRTPSDFRKSQKVNSVQNSSYRPRKLFPNGSSGANSRSPNAIFSPKSAATPKLNTSNLDKLKNSISLKNISPNGTVIVRGSNSVTITPRKVVQERPPVQRTLFKNEIEGVIAARSENGVLKYVVNLANGTHMPLTNLQVRNLRIQNGGALPLKLKIPVPSDVAAKIEPSFLIED